MKDKATFKMLEKIISGGQTGADRAALDVAIKFVIEDAVMLILKRLKQFFEKDHLLRMVK